MCLFYAAGYVFLEDEQYQDYCDRKIMAIIFRLHKLEVYQASKEKYGFPMRGSVILQLDFGEISKVERLNEVEY